MTQRAAPPLAVGAPAPPSRRLTRQDVIRAGRHGSPWEFVPLALAALRVLPSDADIHFLLSAAYAQLGLRTAAMEQLDRLPAPLQADPNVLALRAAARALADDRLGQRELERTARANVDALRLRAVEPVDLRPYFERWLARIAHRECFRAGTGDAVWRTSADESSWERFEGQKDMAAALRLEHDPSPTAPTHPPPYFVEGMDPPWLFLRLYASTPPRYDGHASLIVVAQRSETQFLDALAQHPMEPMLADPRVRLFIGADAGQRVQRFVRDRTAQGIRTVGPAILCPSTRERITPPLDRIVAAALAQVPQVSNVWSSRVAALYPARDQSWWARRHADALSGAAAPLRVLLVTSRYTTFVRHSVADLAESLRAGGCQARVHMEPDDHAIHDLPADLRAVAEFQPDLIVAPNYLRAQLGRSYAMDVPFITWVQDSMAHLFDPRAGAAIGALDFVIGNLREEMFQQFGYPRARALHAPMAASARKFHPGPARTRDAARHACEIAYVSHHSQTVGQLHRRRRAEPLGAADPAPLLDALFPKIMAIVDSPIAAGPLLPKLLLATVAEIHSAGLVAEAPAIASLMHNYTLPIADRALRHRTLEWAARIAAARNWRLHLYGRAWETHPTLAHLARGQLDHGEDLRACYQSARTHLHISLHTAIHQRVFECVMSGGLPLCRLQADDLSLLEYLAAATACRTQQPAAIDTDRITSDGYRYGGYPLGSSPPARRYAQLLGALDLPVPPYVWLNQVHAQRLRSSQAERIDGQGASICDLWPDPAALMFHDEPTLERVLVRAVEDDAWRATHSRALGAHVRARVSYDVLARTLLGFVSSRLSGTVAVDPPRWYDGRSSASSPRPATFAK